MERCSRREFLKTSAAAAGLAVLPGAAWAQSQAPVANAPAPARRPNLLFVFSDQHRRQAMGFMGQDPVLTPHFDRFATQSVVLTQAISSVPCCSPYRSMMMTGRYPLSTGVTTNCCTECPQVTLRPEEVCVGDVLKAAGYQTGYIGKWHLTAPNNGCPESLWDAFTPPGPQRHGFDFWYSYGTSCEFWKQWYYRDTAEKIVTQGWSPQHETDVALDTLRRRNNDQPFALFLSWNPPHPPYVCPEEYRALYEGRPLTKRANYREQPVFPEWTVAGGDRRPSEAMRSYFGAVSSVDAQFGRLMQFLEEEGLAENTVVVYTADHGEMMGSHGMRGKTVPFEESIGVPFMIRWPGRLAPRSEEQLVFDAVDVMPTLLGVMGLQTPAAVEGSDYAPILSGQTASTPNAALIQDIRCSSDPGGGRWRGVRGSRYVYLADRESPQYPGLRRLYDLHKDPYQMNPIVRGQGRDGLLDEFEDQLRERLGRTGDPFALDARA